MCLQLIPSDYSQLLNDEKEMLIKDEDAFINNEDDLLLLDNNTESVSIKVSDNSRLNSQFDDIFAGYEQSSVSSVIPCIVCGNDSLFCCKKCHQCYYCSLQCYHIHSSYHAYSCSGETVSMLPTNQLIRNGIINTGNTCYLASSLQALYSVTPFRQLLLGGHLEEYLNIDVILIKMIKE